MLSFTDSVFWGSNVYHTQQTKNYWEVQTKKHNKASEFIGKPKVAVY